MNRLRDALEPELRVFAQVPMGAILEPDLVDGIDYPKGSFLSTRARFAQKVVDYVVTDNHYQVVALIELDDATHEFDKDAKRDAWTRAAGYTTVRYDSRSRPTIEEIQDDFMHLLDDPTAD